MRKALIGGHAVLLLTTFLSGVAGAESTSLEEGRRLFQQKQCRFCHRIEENGPQKIGPDLYNVGSRRDSAWIKKFLQDPKGTLPGAKMMPVQATEEEISKLVEYLSSLKQ